jgi:uncharacterized protein
MKYLLFFVIVGLVWWVWSKRAASDANKANQKPRPAERMVACAQCGVNLPRSDSLEQDGKHYCCVSHRDAGPTAGGQ